MTTIEKLNAYSTALEKWMAKKRRYDLANEAGKPEKKPLESEPVPMAFEIANADMEWAEKIRRKIMTPKPPIQTLDSQLPKTIKIPVRKTI